MSLCYVAKIYSTAENLVHKYILYNPSIDNNRYKIFFKGIDDTNFDTELIRHCLPFAVSSPPWPIKIPQINTVLTLYPKTKTNHNDLRNASKTQTGAGAAAITTNQENFVKLLEHCIIYTGEVIAIKEALQIAKILPEKQIMIVRISEW
ncbi:hypothetical protein HHI36_022393, partial [Cryptolaemus montrouzieri]